MSDGYRYGGPNRSSDAGQLQKAIWYFEGEAARPTSGKALSWAQDAEAVGSSQAWIGIGQFRILQLYKGDTGYRQDRFYLTPIPGAVILGILGLGAAILKLRKFA